MKNREIENVMTLSELRESGLTGEVLTRDQMDAIQEEMRSKMIASSDLEKDLAALKDKYIKKHNGTGISPDARKFRPIWDYGSRENITRSTYGGKREKLLALWDEREKCLYEDQYTRYLDSLIEAAGDLCTDDLVLYNRTKAEYDKAFMERYEAERRARKARKAAAEAAGKVC